MIEIENLAKRYGPTRAVSGISFSLPKGRVLAFLGPNGAGKSTTMKILTGYLLPDGGKATVGGYDVVAHPLDAQRVVGYLPEHNPLYDDMAVVDFLRFAALARGVPRNKLKPQMIQAVEACGLGDVLHKGVGELSKGYRQRVGLAQALVHEPSVLILDEPTGGLDPNQRREILELIRRVGREKTVIHSTHLLDEVRQTSDRTVIIHRGKMVADGTPRDIARAAGGEATVRVSLGTSEVAARVALERLESVRAVEPLRDDDWEPRGADEPAAGGKKKRGKKPAEQKHHGKDGVASFRLRLRQGADCRREVSALAQANHWDIVELALEVPSLEDIFRQLTAAA